MRNQGSSLAAFVVTLLVGIPPLTAETVIPRGIDVFTTSHDGSTHYDFAKEPIPAGFFCERSKAFTGRVTFKGLPLVTGTPGQLGKVDTIVERLDDVAFDARGTAATRVRLRALSLVSSAPIKTACGAFHVYVSLAGKQQVTTMRLFRTQEKGGHLVAPLAVKVRMSFIPVKPSRSKSPRKLELTGSFTFHGRPTPWSLAGGPSTKLIGSVVVDTNGDLTPDTLLFSTSKFWIGERPQTITAPTEEECIVCSQTCKFVEDPEHPEDPPHEHCMEVVACPPAWCE